MSKIMDAKSEAGAVVDDWAKHWQREGRLEGGLDRLARANLIDRVAAAISARDAVGHTTLSVDQIPQHADAPAARPAPAPAPGAAGRRKKGR